MGQIGRSTIGTIGAARSVELEEVLALNGFCLDSNQSQKPGRVGRVGRVGDQTTRPIRPTRPKGRCGAERLYSDAEFQGLSLVANSVSLFWKETENWRSVARRQSC